MRDADAIRIQNGEITVESVPQLNAKYALPVALPSLALDANAQALVDALPLLERSVIARTFESKGAGALSTKVEVGAYRRICSKQLYSFKYYPPILVGDETICWVGMRVPASMMKDKGASKKKELAGRLFYDVSHASI
jgi:hypothetical protein